MLDGGLQQSIRQLMFPESVIETDHRFSCQKFQIPCRPHLVHSRAVFQLAGLVVIALHADESVFPATPVQLFQTSLLNQVLLCPFKKLVPFYHIGWMLTKLIGGSIHMWLGSEVTWNALQFPFDPLFAPYSSLNSNFDKFIWLIDLIFQSVLRPVL